MKVTLSIEIEAEDLVTLEGAPNATVDGMIDMIQLHTSMVIRNYCGKMVKFDVDKKLDTDS